MLFHAGVFDDYNIEYPYQMVRDGKWTLDELKKSCQAAANLNGYVIPDHIVESMDSVARTIDYIHQQLNNYGNKQN